MTLKEDFDALRRFLEEDLSNPLKICRKEWRS